MSGEKYIKQAIIAALCEHIDADKYRRRAFSAENLEQVMNAMEKQAQALTKADFLTPDDEGKFIIDTPGGWKNFHKIVQKVQARGEQFTVDDFTRPLSSESSRSLLDSATTHNGLGAVFAAEVWKGRFDEMEFLWYIVLPQVRKQIFKTEGLMPLELKRRVFAAAGKTVPEDRLAKSGLTAADIRECVATPERFEAVNRKLAENGDYFRKEYVLMRDAEGNALFDSRSEPWGRYEAIVKVLREHGERFEVVDYIKQVSRMNNILYRAYQCRALGKVFNPADWAGRLPDMWNLWGVVLPGWKMPPMTDRDFGNAYAEAEGLTYAREFRERSLMGKADLFRPLNGGGEGEKPVLPLGLKAVWDKYDDIAAALKALGEEPLKLSDLRVISGEMENSCLMSAVKFDRFDKILDISRQSGEALSLDDFLSKDRQGNTVLSILAEKNQLARVFASDIWIGRIRDMQALWLRVGGQHRTQIDFPQALVDAQQATLKQKKGGIKILPSAPKKPS